TRPIHPGRRCYGGRKPASGKQHRARPKAELLSSQPSASRYRSVYEVCRSQNLSHLESTMRIPGHFFRQAETSEAGSVLAELRPNQRTPGGGFSETRELKLILLLQNQLHTLRDTTKAKKVQRRDVPRASGLQA